MDVPLVLNDIGIQQGLKGRNRKSSTFSLITGVVGLSVLYMASILILLIEMTPETTHCYE